MTFGENMNQPITSKKEIWAFWVYNSALSGVGQLDRLILYPLIMNGLARGYGYYRLTSDTHIDCEPTNLTAWNNSRDEYLKAFNLTSKDPCYVKVGGMEVSTVSYAENVVGVSVLVQAILFISLAAFADYGSSRKNFLVVIGIFGSLITMTMPIAYKPELFMVASVIALIVSVAQSCSYVFLDAFFPILVRNDPLVLEHESFKRQNHIVTEDENEKTLPGQSYDTRGGYIQSVANMASFGTGLFFLAVSAVVSSMKSGIFIMEVLSASTGLWWLILGLYSWINIRPRPGPPLPPNENYIIFSWKKIISTIMKCRQIPHTFYYLVSFFFFGDAMHTLAQIAILFCQEQLEMTSFEVFLVSALFPLSGLLGSAVLYWVQQQIRVTSKSMLIVCLGIMSLIPLYALLGVFTHAIGLNHKWEAYVIVALYGFLYGGILTFGKVIFSSLIPKGCESEFFALSSLADRGSSWIGAFLVSGITSLTHDVRYGMVSLVLLFIISFPFLFLVNVDKGGADAKALSMVEAERLLYQQDVTDDVLGMYADGIAVREHEPVEKFVK